MDTQKLLLELQLNQLSLQEQVSKLSVRVSLLEKQLVDKGVLDAELYLEQLKKTLDAVDEMLKQEIGKKLNLTVGKE
jgi:hypothetical protein